MGKKAEVKKAVVSAKEAQEVKQKLKEKAQKIAKSEDLGGRKREMINIQHELEKAFLLRMVKQERLKDMKKVLEWVDGQAKKGLYQTTVRFQGETFTPDYMGARFKLEVFNYKEAIGNEEYLENELRKNWGFSKEEIEQVKRGRYKKQVPDSKIGDKGSNQKERIDYVG